MLGLEQFEALKMGDQVEAPGLFPGLDKQEPLLLEVNLIEGNVKAFVVTYFGVTLGRWRCRKNGEALSWQL